jgi:hypothetical protein
MEASEQMRVRKITSWQARFTGQGSGQPGINTFQLILDDGAAHHALITTAQDADNLFDWLSDSGEVYFDVGSEQVIFETKGARPPA